MAWFTHILDILFPPRATELVVRNAQTSDLLTLIDPKENSVEGVTITSLLPYENPLVQSCILEAKFHGNTKALALLAEVLVSYLPEYVSEALSYGRQTTIVPVPLSRKRFNERGYNQVLEIVSRAVVGTDVGLVSPRSLHRMRDTRAQTNLSGRERRENMHGAFEAREVDMHRSYLVVDDVSTTGATLSSAHKALTDAGAMHISLLSLAH